MPSKYRTYIAFPSEEEQALAHEKAKNRDMTLSQIITAYFRKLPVKPKR